MEMREHGELPTEGEGTSQDPSQPHKLSRRELLRKASLLGGLILVSAVNGSRRVEAETSTESEIQKLQMIEEAKNTAIDFPVSPEARSASLESVLRSVLVLNDAQFLARQIDPSKFSYNQFKEFTEPIREDYTVVERPERTAWEAIKTHTGSQEAFSRRVLYEYLIRKLPQELARCGVFMRVAPILVFSPTDAQLPPIGLVFRCVEISRVEHRSLERWGKTIDCPILYLGNEMTLDGTVRRNESVGKAYYQAITIHESNLSQERQDEQRIMDDMPGLLESLHSTPPEFLWARLAESAGQDRPKLAVALAQTQLAAKQLLRADFTSEGHAKQVLEGTIAHESGHVFDQADEIWQRQFRSAEIVDALDFLDSMHNTSAHEEIDGKLTELRYGPDKAEALRRALSGYGADNSEAGQGHDSASDWVLNRILDRVTADPKRFGCVVDPEHSVPVRDQLLIQLDRLSDFPVEIEQMAEELWKYHREHLDEQLGTESTRSYRPLKSKTTRETIASWIFGVSLTGLALEGMRGFLQRRAIRLIEGRIRHAFGKKRRPHAINIIHQLQLQRRIQKDGREYELRQQALRKLIDLQDRHPELTGIVPRLNRYMDDETRTLLKEYGGKANAPDHPSADSSSENS